MAENQELRSEIYEFEASSNTHNQVSTVVVVQLDDQPVECGNNLEYGDVTWRTLISADRTPSSDILLGVAEFPAHGVLHLHRHEPAEFYLCLTGSGVVTIDGEHHPITAGSAVFLPGNVEHGVVAGAEGLSLAYGFAQHSFADINYVFSANTPSLPVGRSSY